MIKTIVLQNEHVQACWQEPLEMVHVSDIRKPERQKTFAGFDGLKELFSSYYETFNDQIDFAASVEFFKPQVKQFTVNNNSNT